MTDQPKEHYAQQIIVPAYVWADGQQRTAVLTASVRALATRAEHDGKTVVGQLVDAEVHVTFLQAQVGSAQLDDKSPAVDFVAYEPCIEELADLVSVHVDAAVTEIEGSKQP